ncbi:MAG: hypothetical protein H7A23_08705 [Leptospiraceae bacterium]|nr:hypothetical protein [Leptospiraceae bacterium]MCP5494625.1 hypothetical protein [Leptospiraceae bacterium]
MFIIIVILGITGIITYKTKFLHIYRIPVSLTSSIVVLLFFSIFQNYKSNEIFIAWKEYPSLFIALVFAALFLETTDEKNKQKSKIIEVLSQGVFVWIAILGQIIIGIILTLFLFKPLFGLPIVFYAILEAGFAGGHGTAVAIRNSLESNGMPNGSEYALFSATIGLIFSIIIGIYLIKDNKTTYLGIQEHKRIHGDPIQFIVSLTLILSAFLVGVFIKQSIDKIIPVELPTLPLFIFTLFGSILIKLSLRLTKHEYLIQNDIITLFSNVFMELLIFTAISTLDLQIISDALLPLFILFTIGFAWNIFSIKRLSEELIQKEYRTELGILNFGMLGGTTVIGLMLLKMLDPEFKSKAVKIYAEAAPLSSPFVGGGVLTLTLPYLIYRYNPYAILFLLLCFWILLYAFGRWLYKFSNKGKLV